MTTKINVWEEWHYAHSVINWNEEARQEIARKAAGECEYCGSPDVVGVNGYGERYCAGCLQDMIDSIDDAMLGRAR